MKKIFYMVIIVPAFLAGCSPIIYTNAPQQPVYNQQPQQTYADQPQTDQVFYDELSPYGQWIDYPDYGYVWQPNVEEGFRPYVTDGNWVYSDYGWTWVSDFSWGWAPFHYGNWFYDNSYGWLWEPGHQWAPAWVTWGQSGNYYGWAPVPPQGNNMGGEWRPRNEDWNFVPAQNIAAAHVNRYVVQNNTTVINNTTIINNVTTNNVTTNNITNNITNNRNTSTVIYNRGPRVTDVENITNTKIQQVKINGSARPGQSMANNQLNVYRPDIKPNTTQGNAKPAPQKVINYRQGNNQNPGQQQNQTQDKKQGNGQNNNQKPLLQQNQPPQKPVNEQGNTTNPNQPLKKTLIMNQNPGQQQANPPQGTNKPLVTPNVKKPPLKKQPALRDTTKHAKPQN